MLNEKEDKESRSRYSLVGSVLAYWTQKLEFVHKVSHEKLNMKNISVGPAHNMSGFRS